jgi:Uma2 family endonuclease
MSTANKPRALIAVAYADYAQEYLRGLPPEHFMEATSQGTQREITLESLALVKARRPDLHVFNELLVQYPRRGQKRPGQVVPDNMVVVCDQPIRAEGSFDTPLQPAGPFWVLEYVSRHNKRKDYEDNFVKYERELKVPYYLLFYPEDQELTLFHHSRRRYVTVKPNEHGRYAVAQLDLEVALLDGWVRFWHQGELLRLPADLQRELDKARREARQQRRRAEQERRRAEQAISQAEQERSRAEQAAGQAEQERRARLAAEREVARLRDRLAELEGRPTPEE